MMLANFLWIMSYDTSYALSDRDDDKLLGIGSSAIFFEGYERASIFLFGLLIILFTYFYTAITVPTNKMADDLKRSGGFVPGIKPGGETS